MKRHCDKRSYMINESTNDLKINKTKQPISVIIAALIITPPPPTTTAKPLLFAKSKQTDIPTVARMMNQRNHMFLLLTLAPTLLAFSSPKSSRQIICTKTSFRRGSPILLLTPTEEGAPDVVPPPGKIIPDKLVDGMLPPKKQLELAGDACILADPKEDAELWTWRILLLAITGLWGANFAIVKQAADALGTAEAITLFTAGRFLLGAGLLSPALLKTSSFQVVKAGAAVGSLTTVGYAAQVAACSMGTQAGTAAFICSLNAVVVAVMIGQKTGCVSPRTWWAIALSVVGVACLELPTVLGDSGAGFCLGDLVAFGQPLGFGASYVLLEQSLADHPEDELPIAALQVLMTCFAALAAASWAYGAPIWELPWDSLLPNAAVDASTVEGVETLDWTVSGPLIYSGTITSALTIWLQMVVFAKLPAVDASLLMTTEPLWAVLTAVWLLGDIIGLNDCVGGALILLALTIQQGLIFNEGPIDLGPRLTYDMKNATVEASE
jgi:drug/metabolite transporter (DMT)-like permease